MATIYSKETDGVLDSQAPKKAAPQVYRSKVKRIRATIIMAAQASGTVIVIGDLPVGAVFSHGMINASAALGGTATIAVGTPTDAAKYRAVAIHNTADTPTPFGKVSASSADPATSETRVIATTGAAALPGAGTLEIDVFYSDTV